MNEKKQIKVITYRNRANHSILNSIVNRELASKYSVSGDVVASAVKEIVYSRKDEIVEMVVDRAVKEIVRKGLPKLLERECEK